jgi:hypothetical protein
MEGIDFRALIENKVQEVINCQAELRAGSCCRQIYMNVNVSFCSGVKAMERHVAIALSYKNPLFNSADTSPSNFDNSIFEHWQLFPLVFLWVERFWNLATNNASKDPQRST